MRFIRFPLLTRFVLAGAHLAMLPAASGAAGLRAAGAFDVVTTPAGEFDTQAGTATARFTLTKTFHGALSASGKGEMLTAMGSKPGSAAYVAIERIDGTLDGKRGSFIVHHTGTRSGGVDKLSIAIVADSGSGQLQGISGVMAIEMVDGKHVYTLDYQLP